MAMLMISLPFYTSGLGFRIIDKLLSMRVSMLYL